MCIYVFVSNADKNGRRFFIFFSSYFSFDYLRWLWMLCDQKLYAYIYIYNFDKKSTQLFLFSFLNDHDNGNGNDNDAEDENEKQKKNESVKS